MQSADDKASKVAQEEARKRKGKAGEGKEVALWTLQKRLQAAESKVTDVEKKL